MSPVALIQTNNGAIPYLTPTLLTNCFGFAASSPSTSPTTPSPLSFAINFCDAALCTTDDLTAAAPPPTSDDGKSQKKSKKRKRPPSKFSGRPLSTHFRFPENHSTLIIPGFDLELNRNCLASNAKKAVKNLRKKSEKGDSGEGDTDDDEGIGLLIDTQKGRTKLTPKEYVASKRSET